MESAMSNTTEIPQSTALRITVVTIVILLGNGVLQADDPFDTNLFRRSSPPLSTQLTSVNVDNTETTGKASLDDPDPVALTGYSINVADEVFAEKPNDENFSFVDNPRFNNASDAWTWQCLPNGLMYKSYLANEKGPRFATVWSGLHGRPPAIGGNGYIWDATLGARVGVLRYGTNTIVDPQGWQLDMEGAAMPRLDLQSKEDVIGTDFRFGVPITYRRGPTAFKFGYYHISSHLGDEFQLKYPFYKRDNYVREAVLVGLSHEPTDFTRVYAQAAYAISDGGIVDPWEFLFGFEYSALGRSGVYSSPFFAINVHLREELNYSGSVNVQTGWQWRGPESDHLWRIGLQYFNGPTSQFALGRFQEQMLGFGMWYDF